MSKREIENWDSEDFSDSASAFEPQTLSDHFEDSTEFSNDDVNVQTDGNNSNSNDQTKSKEKSQDKSQKKSKKKKTKQTNPFRFAFHTQKLVCNTLQTICDI